MIKKLPEFDQLTEYVVQGKDGLEVKKCEAKAEKEPIFIVHEEKFVPIPTDPEIYASLKTDSERIAFLAEKAGFVK